MNKTTLNSLVKEVEEIRGRLKEKDRYEGWTLEQISRRLAELTWKMRDNYSANIDLVKGSATEQEFIEKFLGLEAEEQQKIAKFVSSEILKECPELASDNS